MPTSQFARSFFPAAGQAAGGNLSINALLISALIWIAVTASDRHGVRAETPVDVGNHNQLFIDELFVAESHGIALKVQPPRKTHEIILKSEHPWESATLNWFTVLQDRGCIDGESKYRMWYEAYDVEGWPTADDTSFCYAESRDGVKWTKPELGLFSYQASNRNNILFRQIGSANDGSLSRVHGTGVFIDLQAPAAARFKAISQGIFANRGAPPHRIAGMYSPDGLKWTRYPEPICDLFADSQYSGFRDASTGDYVIYGRVAGQIGRSSGADFEHFENLTPVLNVTPEDPANSNLYNSAVMKYPYAPNIYFMFPSLFQRIPDTLDIRLAVSRDGVHWTRPDQSTPFIPLGASGEFDSGSLYMGQGILRDDDQISFYYSGSPLKHEEVTLEHLAKRENARAYSRVVTPLDRFVAAVAGREGGNFTTPPLRFTGNYLQLNVKVQPGGHLRIGLLDAQGQPIPGYSVNDCIPVVGDSLSVRVKWNDNDEFEFPMNAVMRLQFDMTSVELYGFQFTDQ
ncbi:MAG: hypothetical protein KDB01_08380 [Planctomycetaceae bacterium]|nr:hypothetical protein [Planctomycetaceae bacterium]